MIQGNEEKCKGNDNSFTQNDSRAKLMKERVLKTQIDFLSCPVVCLSLFLHCSFTVLVRVAAVVCLFLEVMKKTSCTDDDRIFLLCFSRQVLEDKEVTKKCNSMKTA